MNTYYIPVNPALEDIVHRRTPGRLSDRTVNDVYWRCVYLFITLVHLQKSEGNKR